MLSDKRGLNGNTPKMEGMKLTYTAGAAPLMVLTLALVLGPSFVGRVHRSRNWSLILRDQAPHLQAARRAAGSVGRKLRARTHSLARLLA